MNSGGTDTKKRQLTLYFGPQHVGMVGNFSITLTVEGDTIQKAAANPGFLHRGFEKMLEDSTYIQGFPFVCRINVMDPDPNEQVYAMAIEELSGLEVPPRGQYLRTIILEMSRLASHLGWLWAYANELGFDTVGHWAMAQRDYFLDLFDMITGGRVYHIYIWPGGVRRDMPAGFAAKMRGTLDGLEKSFRDYDAVFFNNRVFRKRVEGVGVISQGDALRLGVTGGNLRATGLARDVRKVEPYAAYDYMDFEIPTMPDGDSYARAMVIRGEMKQSASIIRQALDKLPAGPAWNRVPNPFKWRIPPGEAYVRMESARGELGAYAVSDGTDKIHRMAYRVPSYPHGILVLENLLQGMNIADVGHMLLSLNIAAPEIDR
ncbi:MAG: NADH-quinone oxidoreductase subunit D [Candidatus Bipolaricaulota bacterium]|nr:NADH-quinone oxidoreductase subunit D [Candidatus Bipolaricaulota bacterium]